MKFVRPTTFVVAMTVLASCAGKEKKANNGGSAPANPSPGASAQPSPGSGEAKAKRGCLQGMVFDGYTGKPIDIKGTSGPGIFVRIKDQKIAASAADQAFPGEYYICDIPLDETYLLYAQFDNYQIFDSRVKVDSTIGKRASEATDDISKEVPMRIGNIRLFPLGMETHGLAFYLFHNGKAVEKAQVTLKAAATNNALVVEGDDFLAQNSARIAPLVNVTTEGVVRFESTDLVIGARYAYQVSPSNDDFEDVSVGFFNGAPFTLGVDKFPTETVDDKKYYKITVNLETRDEDLKLVSCSTKESGFNGAGEITYVFNQAIVAVDKDGWKAAIDYGAAPPAGGGAPKNGQTPVAVADDIPDNSTSEQVTTDKVGTSEPSTLIVKPILAPTSRQPSATIDTDIFVSFSGIKLRKKTGKISEGQETLTLDGLVAAAGANSGCKTYTQYFKQP